MQKVRLQMPRSEAQRKWWVGVSWVRDFYLGWLKLFRNWIVVVAVWHRTPLGTAELLKVIWVADCVVCPLNHNPEYSLLRMLGCVVYASFYEIWKNRGREARDVLCTLRPSSKCSLRTCQSDFQSRCQVGGHSHCDMQLSCPKHQ